MTGPRYDRVFVDEIQALGEEMRAIVCGSPHPDREFANEVRAAFFVGPVQPQLDAYELEEALAADMRSLLSGLGWRR